MASSKFVEILDDDLANPVAQQHQMSDSDVKLEDVLADHEATIQQHQHQRSRSSTQSSSTPSRKSHEFNPASSAGGSSGGASDNNRRGSDTTESQSQGSPSSTTNSSPTSPIPRIKRLRKFTLTGGFGR